ncbi:competence protein ComK [Neobacillus sp. OS1-2]|uniref:competence protein ComK n=1 Tax=Neobacillus sp. OS1-2 TaxID=3070680 RepID=UPI0027E0CEFF|nr:competence protein ComK [Neobacillus sp. OS1-2]WML41514.1 competence protein ComK [Neobacillus sp. OS1-2]
MTTNQFYLVDDNVILMTGEYDNNGKLCARVMIGRETLLVDQSPVKLLDETLKYIGFNLKGALEGAKGIIGEKYMRPVMVNPYKGICLFPNKSPKKDDCLWFNPDHIVKTNSRGYKTEVVLSNGVSILVDLKLCFFNSKLHIASELKRTSIERGNHSNPIVPERRKPLSRSKNGKYNFGSIA